MPQLTNASPMHCCYHLPDLGLRSTAPQHEETATILCGSRERAAVYANNRDRPDRPHLSPNLIALHCRPPSFALPKQEMIPTLVPRSIPENDRDRVVVPLARAPVPDGPLQIEHSALTGRILERHWIAASILAHLLIIVAMILGLLEARQPAPPAVLKITLIPEGPGSAGAAGGKNGGGDADTQRTKQPENPTSKPEPVAPAPLPPEKPPPLLAKPDVVEPMQPVTVPPAPAPITTPPPVKTTAPAQLVMEIPLPKPRHAPPRRRAQTHRETQSSVKAPVPAPLKEAKTEPAQTATVPAAAAGIGAGPGKGLTGPGKGAIGNTAGPGDDYLERLYRHLLRYKKYPPEAISAKQQGSAVVGFVIARDGTISDARIEKSSGSSILDQATLTMVQRASPAPVLPDSFKPSEARVRFPIDYKLSLIDQMF
jgi:periplasmic protein TonB